MGQSPDIDIPEEADFVPVLDDVRGFATAGHPAERMRRRPGRTIRWLRCSRLRHG